MNEIFDSLKKIFNDNGFRLYMIGSTSRDYLLNKEITDYDFVSDATPKEVSKFIDVDTTFSKYGITNFHFKGIKIDLATLRKETNYEDYRHPSKIEFIKDINIDYLRRDFTINAIYIDENYQIIDPSKGVIDLKNKVLKMIGDPYKRIKEDPLRILRAKRFEFEYNLTIEEPLKKALEENEYLLKELNPDKIHMELLKLEKIKREEK